MSTYYLDGRDLRELVKQVKTGNVIVLYEGPYDEFEPDLFGVIIRIKDQFLRNGEKLICKCKSIFLEKDGISNTEYLCNGWFPDLMGNVIMKIDNPAINKPEGESEPTTSKLLRNGESLIYEGVIDGCAPNLIGIVIKQNDDFSILSWSGTMVHICHSLSYDWRADETGMIARIDDRFFHNGELSEKDQNGNVHENIDGIVYNGPWCNWDSGFSKLVIRFGDKLFRNGVKQIYEGEFDSARAHPNGILIVRDYKFSLVVYKDNSKDLVGNAVVSLVTEVMGNEEEYSESGRGDFPAQGQEIVRSCFSGQRRPR